MLPRSRSAHQTPADPPAIDIGVGIDTSRYGHYAAFLTADLQTAAPDLEVLESATGYARLGQRLVDLVARHGSVHFHVRSQRDVRAAALDLVHVFGLEPCPLGGTEKRNG